MARNNECIIFVLDVRQNANEESKLRSIKNVSEIIKEKITGAKRDYISFVLLGTESTLNDANSTYSHESYLNITQYPHVQLPTWELLMSFYKFINETACIEGEWLDALVVAMDMINNNQKALKFQRQRIVLFHDFDGESSNFDQYDLITQKIMEMQVDLIVVSNNIMYIDNSVNGEPQAVFCDSKKTSPYQLENEKYALRLVSYANAKLCNFEEAFRTLIYKVENSRPWSWNSVLNIGKHIKIQISGIIMIKDESKIKLKKCWGDKDLVVKRVLTSFKGNDEIDILDEDLIDGYMLGATAIPYDESLREEKEQHETGLHFLGFVKRKSISDVYLCGDSLYCVVHKKGFNTSAKELDALVRALLSTKMVMLCWKVYGVKFNNPKLVVLIPNELCDNKPASLSMIDLAYYVQHNFYDFPSLKPKKTQFTDAQINAIDNLIDSMDLLIESKDGEKTTPRKTFQKDLIPFDTLPNIYTQNLRDILERKIICNASEDDEQFQEMLQDKNFVELYWKLPEEIEQAAKNAAKVVKELFPLEKRAITTGKNKTNVASSSNGTHSNDNLKGNVKVEQLAIDRVGAKTPAIDFDKLLQNVVMPIHDHTLRDKKYQTFAEQMRTAIWNLLFKSDYLETEQIERAIKSYRKSCFTFNALHDYNQWIREVKTCVCQHGLIDFWQKVIVKNNLGIGFFGEQTLDDKISLEHFYEIDASLVAKTQRVLSVSDINDDSMDEVMANI